MRITGLRLSRKKVWATGIVVGLIGAATTAAVTPATVMAGQAGGPAWKHTKVPLQQTILADVAADKTTWTVGYALPSDGFGFKPKASQRTGGSWSKNRAAGLPAHGRLDGVDTVGRHIWAVGQEEIPAPGGDRPIGYRAMAARWNGAKWESARLPLPKAAGDAETQLQDIDVLPGGEAWAVGSQKDQKGTERGLVLHYDGTRWKGLKSPKDASFISDVTAVGKDSVWITSGDQVSHWDGIRWTNKKFPAAAGAKPDLESIAGRSDRNLWVAGYTQTGGIGTRKPFATHFDGRTWTRIAMPKQDKATLLDAAMTAKNRAMAVGYTTTDRFYTLTLSPGGAKHGPVPAQPPKTPGDISGISASPAGLWTVGSMGDGAKHQPVAAHLKSLPGQP
jgi:hypothetical protein